MISNLTLVSIGMAANAISAVCIVIAWLRLNKKEKNLRLAWTPKLYEGVWVAHMGRPQKKWLVIRDLPTSDEYKAVYWLVGTGPIGRHINSETQGYFPSQVFPTQAALLRSSATLHASAHNADYPSGIGLWSERLNFPKE